MFMTTKQDSEENTCLERPVWRRPTINAVAISEVTLLGKLGSAVDLGGENDYSPD